MRAFRRQRQGRRAALGGRSPRSDVILIDHALSPARSAISRRSPAGECSTATAHPRHLRAACAQLRGQAGSRTRTVETHRQPPRARWTHLERQKGGIGMRGPGETQLETDRRLIAQRVRVLTKRLGKIKQQRETGRQMRAEIPVPSLALVGYTNAGKSTLFRSLTGADAYVADQLFATLDQQCAGSHCRRHGRGCRGHGGFIRELPHELVAAFQSTLTRLAQRPCCCTSWMRVTRVATSTSHRWMWSSRRSARTRFLKSFSTKDRSPGSGARVDRDGDGRSRPCGFPPTSALDWSSSPAQLQSGLRDLRAVRGCGFGECRSAALATVRGEGGAQRARCRGRFNRACGGAPDLELLTLAARRECRFEVQGRRRLVRPGMPTYNRRPFRARQPGPAKLTILIGGACLVGGRTGPREFDHLIGGACLAIQ